MTKSMSVYQFFFTYNKQFSMKENVSSMSLYQFFLLTFNMCGKQKLIYIQVFWSSQKSVFFYKRLRETMILMFRLNAFSQFSKQFSPNVSGENRYCQSKILKSLDYIRIGKWKRIWRGLLLDWYDRNYKFLPACY